MISTFRVFVDFDSGNLFKEPKAVYLSHTRSALGVQTFFIARFNSIVKETLLSLENCVCVSFFLLYLIFKVYLECFFFFFFFFSDATVSIGVAWPKCCL